MKRTLLIVFIIGLLLVPAMDLQARHRGRVLPRIVRAGIVLAAVAPVLPLAHRYRHERYSYRAGYDRYPYDNGRAVAREIRRNEELIWRLERRIDRLDRHFGNRWEIQRLEQEVYALQRRNDFLRDRLY